MFKFRIFLLISFLFITNLNAEGKTKFLTIQEEWVDTGYFEWNDESKTSLPITEISTEQEYLPDVRDGKQLISAYYIFSQFRLTADLSAEYKIFR